MAAQPRYELPFICAGKQIQCRQPKATSPAKLYLEDGNGGYNKGDGTFDLAVTVGRDDTWKGANCDLDFYIFRDIPGQPPQAYNGAQGAKVQKGASNHHPYETVIYPNAPKGNYYVQLRRYNCTHSGDLDYFEIRSLGAKLDYYTPFKSSVGIPSESKGESVLAVGTFPWNNLTTVLYGSRAGPTSDKRVKRDLTAADCGNTSTLPTPGGGDCGFVGTSQSAAHLGGLAEAVWSRYGNIGSRQLAHQTGEN